MADHVDARRLLTPRRTTRRTRALRVIVRYQSGSVDPTMAGATAPVHVAVLVAGVTPVL